MKQIDEALNISGTIKNFLLMEHIMSIVLHHDTDRINDLNVKTSPFALNLIPARILAGFLNKIRG